MREPFFNSRPTIQPTVGLLVNRIDPEIDNDAGPLRSVPTLEDAYRLHRDHVYRLGLRLLGRREDAEDVVQEVYIEAHRGIVSLRDMTKLRGWLSTIAVRIAHRRLRTRKAKAWFGLTSDLSESYADASASPEDATALRAMYKLLERMPVEQRIAWALRHIEQERLDQVALMCGCSLATAKRRIAAAEEFLEREVRLGH